MDGGNADFWRTIALACDGATGAIVAVVGYHALRDSITRRINKLCGRVNPDGWDQ